MFLLLSVLFCRASRDDMLNTAREDSTLVNNAAPMGQTTPSQVV